MEPTAPKRKSCRLPQFDYGSPAYYFLTLCTKEKAFLFGRIVGAAYMPPVQTCLSETGKIAEKNLLAIEPHFPGTRVEKYVIMPNHLHMILSVGCDGKAPAGGIYAAPTVPRIISAYKASVSREAGFAVWQRSFYDHIIRNRSDFEQIWQYIDNNPLNWLLQGKTGTPDTNDVF